VASELSVENMVVVSRVGDYWVNDEQAAKIRTILDNGAKGLIEIKGSYVSINSIDGVITAEDYGVVQLKRRGAWECKYRYWHERGENCAHHLTGRRKT
jgi:hypothetical protein